MIPVSCNEKIKHVDEDGITWEFTPKYGAIEREFMQICDAMEAKKPLEQIDISSDFTDKILVGWNDPKGRMKPFPVDKKPSALLSQGESTKILSMWIKANSLTPEEKKS